MSDLLWDFDAAVAAVGGQVSQPGAPAISGVSIDSRTLAPGALFVAIRGERLDGHAFVDAAFEAGAAAAIVSRDVEIPDAPGQLVRVEDTLAAMNALGRTARANTRAKVIAVTGSVGKTGTKEALRLALAPSGVTYASQKSYNNQWGVPLSLANMPNEARFGVFEVGMNSPGEIEPLTRLIRPHVAIVTTVEPVHLGFFESVEQIAEAKAEIFQGLEPGGTAILNRDNPYFGLLAERAEEAGAGTIVAFGSAAAADVRLQSVELGPDASEAVARIGGVELRYRIGAPGKHLVMNALAVLAAADAVGADLEAAAAALAAYSAQQGRGQRFVLEPPGGTVLLVDESYNANPASMRAALAALAQTPRADFPRRIAVLGDMLELGAAGPDLHRALAEPVDAAGVDVVLACGPQMKALYDALPPSRMGSYATTSAELEPALLEAVRPGDVVMVKGSLGSRMGPLVEALKAHLTASSAG